MVGTRMESRVENVEKEIRMFREDLTQVKEAMMIMKDTLERLERKVDKGGEHELSEGSGAHGDGEKEKDSDEVNDKAKEKESVNDDDSNKYRKLELPLFDGDDAVGWLFRVERYFSINRMKDEDKLEAVAVCLEGRALNWLQWIETRVEMRTWPKFKTELLRRFHQSQLGNGYEMLMALKQTGSAAEYREKFELLSAPLKDAPEDMLISVFLNGLKEDVRAELRMSRAQNLLEVLDLAHKVEDRNMVLAKLKEDQEKANRASRVFPGPKWNPIKPSFSKPFSIASEGITGGRTMKLLGKIQGKRVLIMIDSGASHNFISSSLVAQLSLPKENTSVYEVTVGDGHVVKGQGICRGLKVEMQGAEIKQNFYLFNLGEVDVILGIEWLESLGEVSVNWRLLTMRYKDNEKEIALKGDASLARTEVAFKTVMKSIRKGGQGFLLSWGEWRAKPMRRKR
ncbi:Retrotransposable element Tf2 [Senna tora]|uniref:Retrotransposable element Tf2 n=1 Tax=Senna tora TaxID=362788 RepID=A0A834TA22_9FABA|nr:Retrotransposable element Tf2 [Senna tora]